MFILRKTILFVLYIFVTCQFLYDLWFLNVTAFLMYMDFFILLIFLKCDFLHNLYNFVLTYGILHNMQLLI